MKTKIKVLFLFCLVLVEYGNAGDMISTTDNNNEILTDNTIVTSTDNTTETSTDNTIVTSTDNTTETSTDNTIVTSTDNTTETSTDNTIVTSTDNTTETSTDNTIVTSTDNTTENSADNTTDSTTTPTTQTTTSSSPPIHQGPQYTIGCLANGDVSVKGMSNSSTVQIIKPLLEGCNETILAVGSLVTIPTICLNSKDYTEKRTVTFSIHDPRIDGKKANHLLSSPNLPKGGQNSHTITIECQPLTENGMEVYILHGVGLLKGETIKLPTELDKVEMRLKAEELGLKEDITNLPDVSSVYIGDKFYLYLLYAGKDEYKVIPESCKAYEGAYAYEPSSSIQKVDLWKRENCVQTDAASYHLMHNFKVLQADTNVVYAEMFGFRFSKTDITFVCTVRICPKSTVSDECTLIKDDSCNATSKWTARRRRSSNTNGQYKVLRRMKVTDRKTDNAGGMFSCSWLFVFGMQMFIKLV